MEQLQSSRNRRLKVCHVICQYWVTVRDYQKQERPPIGVKNDDTDVGTTIIYNIAITCSENVYVRPCAYGRTRMCDLNATIIWKWPDDRRFTRDTFRGQGEKKVSNGLYNMKWTTWITLSKTLNHFEIFWTVIKKTLVRFAADRK